MCNKFRKISLEISKQMHEKVDQFFDGEEKIAWSEGARILFFVVYSFTLYPKMLPPSRLKKKRNSFEILLIRTAVLLRNLHNG
jgi:hypothetical protein